MIEERPGWQNVEFGIQESIDQANEEAGVGTRPLERAHLRFYKYSINFGLKEHHPLENVQFFDKKEFSKGLRIAKDCDEYKLESMMPTRNQAKIVRCFVTDHEFQDKAIRAFELHCERFLGGKPRLP